MLNKFAFVAASALLLAACSSDDENEAQQPQQNQYPLSIEVMETPYTAPDASRTTRAEITTKSSLTGFTLNYQYEDVTSSEGIGITCSNGKGNGGNWPSDAASYDYPVNWYANTNGTFVNGLYIDFTVDETTFAQKDLLVAKTSDRYSNCQGKLAFTFDHACTALRFFVKKATNLNDYTLKVSNIRLCNVKKYGQYVLSSGEWRSVDTDANFTLYDGTDLTLNSTDYIALTDTNGPWLFMIPQTLTAWDGTSTLGNTYFQITCTITQNASEVYSGTAYIPFGATLQKGYQHDVKLNIGKNSLYKTPNTKVIN
ncbi:fimbrillin family protein [Prevotella sp. E2-28]|uniref:fimbrillin family protein n=1 Tax=Prevotella sp. E2-28 TaxID=2913620 RepID=UPI001EDBE62B|nr:fimbrillin family protein [Prevotella sp. E2-28]UKK52413.1 fimbrillin family protein [Prevotella sp. E2-28]